MLPLLARTLQSAWRAGHKCASPFRRNCGERSLRSRLSASPVLSALIALLLIVPAFGQPDSVPPVGDLIRQMSSGGAAERAEAARLLGALGPEAREGVPELVEAFAAEEETVRWSASQALIAVGAEAVGALSRLLSHSDAAVRGEAAFTLGRIGPAAGPAVPQLVAALKDADTDVRKYAVFALGRIGPEAAEAVPELQALAQSQSGEFERPVAEAVARIVPKMDSAADAESGQASSLPPPARRQAINGFAAGLAPRFAAASNVNATADPEADGGLPPSSDASPNDKRRRTPAAKRAIVRLADPSVWLVALGAAFSWIVGWWLIWGTILRVRPVWLLRCSESLRRRGRGQRRRWLSGGKLSLESLLLLSALSRHSRALDAWIEQHAGAAWDRFQKRQSARGEPAYCPLPVECSGVTLQELRPLHLRSALKGRESCILIGGIPGSGKTTLACRLAEWALQDRLADHRLLPAVVSAACGRPLDEAVHEQVQRLIGGEQPLSRELTRLLLNRRRILLIVDDLSDPADPQQQQLLRELRRLDSGTVVVTSRLEKLPELNVSLRLRTGELTADSLWKLMRHFAPHGPDAGFDDAGFFDACRHLASITPRGRLTPLTVRLFVESVCTDRPANGRQDRTGGQTAAGNAFPASFPELIVRLVTAVDDGHDETMPGEAMKESGALRDLGRIAWMCCAKDLRPRSVRRAAVLNELGGPDPSGRLDELKRRFPFIEEAPHDPRRIQIRPDVVAEYLAGLYLVETCAGNVARWHRLLPASRRREPTGVPPASRRRKSAGVNLEADATGSPGEADAFRSRGWSGPTRAGSVAPAVVRLLQAVRDCCLAFGADVPQSVVAELGHLCGLGPDEIERDRVAAQVRDATARLQSTDPRQREAGITVLSRIGPKAVDAVPWLVEALADEDERTRRGAVDALRRIGGPAVPMLTDALADQRAGVRRLAAVALGQIGERASPAADRLRSALDDADESVRANAASALGLIAHSCAPGLEQDAPPRLVESMKPAAKAGYTRPTRLTPRDAAADLLRPLQDDHPYVRACAVRALGLLGPDAQPAVRSLSQALLDEHLPVRRLAADALGRIGPGAVEAAPALVAALLDEEPAVRGDALEALQAIGRPAVGAVIPLLDDADPDVRDAAARALSVLGTDAADAVPHLVRLLKDEYPPIRESAADALERIYSPQPLVIEATRPAA